MPAFTGAKASVLLSGTSTLSTTTAMSNIDGGAWLKYQVTSSTKRVWDPTANVTVFVDGVSQSSSLYTVNRLFGTVTFLSPLTSGNVVTCTFHWLAMTAVAGANSCEASFMRTAQDATTFASNGNTERVGTLGDAQGTIGRFTQMDSLFFTLIENGGIAVVEYDYGVGLVAWRAWVKFEKQDMKADAATLTTDTVSWVGMVDADGRQVAVAP